MPIMALALGQEDLELAKRVFGFPWVLAGVTQEEHQILFALWSIAQADRDLGRLVASYPWVIDGLSETEISVLHVMKAFAASDLELAWSKANQSWFKDGVTYAEFVSFALNLPATTGDLTADISGDLRDHFSAALTELARGLQGLHSLSLLGSKPWLADGLDNREAAFVVALAAAGLDSTLVQDLLQAHFVRTRTVSLPLAGQVNIWAISNAPFPPDDDLLTVIEDTVIISERLMGVPFPTANIVVLVVGEDDETSYRTWHARWEGSTMSVVLLRYKDHRVSFITHETAHYYFSVGPTWLQEGGANFIESYFNDWKGVHDLADRADELASGIQKDCNSGNEAIENIQHLTHVFPGARTGCHYAMGENFLLNVLMTVGEETMSSALGELYLSDREYYRTGVSGQGQRATEEAIYAVLLRYAPIDRRDAFRELYRRLHGGPYAYPDTSFSDDHGDQAIAATDIAVGEAVTGVLDYVLDFDYFRFRAEDGRKYRMTVNHETLRFTGVTLYAPDGLTEEFGKWKSRRQVSSGPQVLWVARESGDYYFAVQNFGAKTGPYTLTIATVDDEVDDHGDRPATATDISIGELVEGSLDDYFDYDFFRLKAEEGQEYRAVVTNAGSFRFTLYLSDGVTSGSSQEVYEWWEHEGDRRIIQWVATSSEHYYLAIEDAEGDAGTYTLTITEVEG